MNENHIACNGLTGPRYLCHSSRVWAEFPELTAGVLTVRGISSEAPVDEAMAHFNELARRRLAAQAESEFPEIKAWRRTFSKMGLKPTQYRCASESLLRRFRKENELPRLHPLIDLCNSISMACALPIAVFDVARISGHLEVRHALGSEQYLSFAGETEQPAPDEIIFADDSGRAHARRWANRQSAWSAVRPESREVLIVIEAMHETGSVDVARILEDLAQRLQVLWSVSPASAVLRAEAPRFDF